jgi:hypothetical protein
MMMLSLPFPIKVIALPPSTFSLKVQIALALLFSLSLSLPLSVLSLSLVSLPHHPLPLLFFVHHPHIFTRPTRRSIEVEPTHTKTHP